MNIDKQVAYWRSGADEDWEVAVGLVEQGKVRHGLFFVDLAVEKLLKAHVCKATGDFAPKIHVLPRLADLSGLSFSPEHLDFLAILNRFCLAGRYPPLREVVPPQARAREFIRKAEELRSWLTKQL